MVLCTIVNLKFCFPIFILVYRNEVDFYILTWFISCNFAKFIYSTNIFGRCLLSISFPCLITLTRTYMIVKISHKNRHSCMEHILWGKIQYFQLCCCRFFIGTLYQMKEVLSVPHLKVLFMNFIKYFFST